MPTKREQASALLRRRDQREAQDRAEMAREQHTVFRLAFQRQRQQHRAQKTLGRRLDIALAEARKLSDVSGVGLEQHVSTGKAESTAPPAQNGLLYAHADEGVAEFYSRRIRLLLEALEREVDGAQLKPLEGELLHELPEQKDARLVKDFEGMLPHEVRFIDQSFGTLAAIERARIRMGREPKRGKVKEKT